MQKRVLKDDYINDKILEDETLEQIKEEYNFTEMKDAFDDGEIPRQLEFVFGGNKNNFLQAWNFLCLNEDNNEFVSFMF